LTILSAQAQSGWQLLLLLLLRLPSE
jgi:hypothetical protein